MDLNGQVLFFSAATKRYLPFVPLYVFFASTFNPDAKFEFIVDNVGDAEDYLRLSLEYLRGTRNVEIAFQEASDYAEKVAMENTLRFIQTPRLYAEWVYIGDVDILIVENVLTKHWKIFAAGLPYSNIIRPGTKKLTGLHFTRYDEYYPLPEIDDIVLKMHNDEEVLYAIVERAGKLSFQPSIDSMSIGRPEHGIHMSLNRIPFASPEMRLPWNIKWKYAQEYNTILSSDDSKAFVKKLPQASRLLLANIHFITKGIVELGEKMFSVYTLPDPIQNPTESIFADIYRKNLWRGAMSRSGPSSDLARTEALRSVLPSILEQYDINVFLDAPCGDFFWMKEIVKDFKCKYLGGDIVGSIVEENSKKYGCDNTEFMRLDLTSDRLPDADLLFCRDCLFHLSYADIANVFRNLLASSIPYFMTTSHINTGGFENRNISTGGWRYFDLFKDPFCFPDNAIESVIDGGGDRLMYLWRMSDLEGSLRLAILRLEEVM